jgi:hypothetical protein
MGNSASSSLHEINPSHDGFEFSSNMKRSPRNTLDALGIVANILPVS